MTRLHFLSARCVETSRSRHGNFVLAAVLLAAATVFHAASALAAAPRVLSDGKVPDDSRLGPLKTLDSYFPFVPAKSASEWEARAEEVRRRMRVSLGLWPMPTKTPLNAVIHGRVDLGDYTVEKAYFESYPGHFVTGNLYRPAKAEGRRPAVLCPHGHWPDGRFHDAGPDRVRRDIVVGGERFEEGGRSPLQARCVQLARMGCVVFHYDMIGYADSVQISFELAHRFAKQRPEMNTVENWGLYSPQAEANMQSILGMQAYNAVRALDFLSELPDVDPNRIAVTGASGGGTQTFTLCAIDPRPAVAYPAVMVSTAMQGGCTCENACGFRVGTGNVEFAALFAPKPQGLSAANDWTKEMETKGFPELKEHYKMLGAPDKVMLAAHLHYGHNYNYVSRAAMYSWLNKHLGLGIKEPIVEEDYRRLTREEMSVWDKDHPAPQGGPEYERKLLRWMTDDSRSQIAALSPRDESSLAAFRQVVGGGVDVLIGRRLPRAADLTYDQTHKADRGTHVEMAGLLRHAPRQGYAEALPIVFLYPKEWGGQVVVWLDPAGKSGLYGEDGSPVEPVRKLVAAGKTVVGVDVFETGEFRGDGTPPAATRRVSNPREFAGYTFGYNDSLFAQRVHDILSVVAFLRSHERAPKSVAVVGLNGAGPWAAAARAQAGRQIDLAAVDTRGFRFGKLLDIHDPDFLPGGAKYADLPGMLALSTPHPLWVAGEGNEAPAPLGAAYQAAAAREKLSLYDGKPEKSAAAAAEWLLKN